MSDREEYFRKFPLINYRGVNSVNIMKRVDFNSNVKNFYEAFYEYTLKESDNIQNLAYDYYEDVDYDWLIYLANDIIDPYFDVPLQQTDFDKYIKKKYGSIEKAQNKIILYKTNYESDPDTILAPNAYDALPGSLKKYWDILPGLVGVVGYSRKKEDLYASTNRVIGLEYAAEQTEFFQTNENVYIQGDLTQTATVSRADGTRITLRNVNGDFNRDSNFTLVGKDSDATIEIAFDTYTLLTQVIPVAEEVYYSPYSAYDFEVDLNEKKRDISLVENFLARDVNNKLTDVLR